MIKAVVQKTDYVIYDTKSDHSIHLQVTDDKIKITDEDGKGAFVFENSNTREIQERWLSVFEMFAKAIEMVNRHKKQVKEFV